MTTLEKHFHQNKQRCSNFFVLCMSVNTCKYVVVLYCTVFFVYSNFLVLYLSVNTCKYIFVLYCNVQGGPKVGLQLLNFF